MEYVKTHVVSAASVKKKQPFVHKSLDQRKEPQTKSNRPQANSRKLSIYFIMYV